ncbi:hypothetical protein CRYUN_Cryun18bG0020900 [Craigia yunnanensis]
MDFFKSVFFDDAQPQFSDQPTDPIPNPGSSSAWSFGGLVKTLAGKSESMIESCRKDFEELGSGLKKETEIIRSVASGAVNDSLEIGASVAQEKLESVGQAIDDIGSSVWKSTTQIISHGKDTFLSPSDDDNSDSENPNNKKLNVSNDSINEKRYSRFEMQIRALQSDNTYSKEPEDSEDFENWKLGFNLEEKKREIEDLLNENSDDNEESGIVDREKKKDLSEDGDWCSKNDEEKAGSCKDSDVSVVSSQFSMPEEEGWDEIEEIRSSNENKGEDIGSANRVDLRKPLSVEEEEEDLSWDIDDDDDEDQPVKS